MMMLWALYSFYLHASTDIGLVVHDDGSLEPSHFDDLRRLFPGSRIVDRKTSDEVMKAHLASFPNCQQLRDRHPLGLKVFDFFHFAQKEKIIFFDSDIIFFEEPTEITKQQDKNVFVEDVWCCYVESPEVLQKRYDIDVPPRINIGFGQVDRETYDRDVLERILSDDTIKTAPYLFAQTSVALLSAHYGVKTVGGSYRMTLKPGISGHTFKHYTQVMRGALYTEGIPFVWNLYSAQMG